VTGSAKTAAGGSTVGVTDTSITLSVVGSFSGPAGAIYQQQYKAAALTWRDEVNAQGGINGRKVVLNKVDDGNTVEGGVAACKSIESNGSFAAFTQSTVDQTLACLDQAGIPAYQLAVLAPNPQTAFKNVRAVVSVDGQAAAMAQFVAGPQGLNRAGHKIGMLYPNDYPYFTRLGEDFIASAKAIGLNVQAQKITTNQASFTAELQRFKDSGVDTVVMLCTPESIGILRDAKALSYSPVWAGTSFDADELVPAAPQAFAGIKSIRY
jgi:ABC-type branched-subunit amino acid transport system substrate-binding protein